MVHIRINERDVNPNPHINFISALNKEEHASQLLHALAAQVKPVMKAHGFTVNSLEEVSHGCARIQLYHRRSLHPF
jgi:DNA-dependent metalloprotease WSS1